jgi:hypothetical protein
MTPAASEAVQSLLEASAAATPVVLRLSKQPAWATFLW